MFPANTCANEDKDVIDDGMLVIMFPDIITVIDYFVIS